MWLTGGVLMWEVSHAEVMRGHGDGFGDYSVAEGQGDSDLYLGLREMLLARQRANFSELV